MFANRTLQSCRPVGSTEVTLKVSWLASVWVKLLPAKRALKTGALPKTHKRWIKAHAEAMMNIMIGTLDSKNNMSMMLQVVAKKSGLFVTWKLELSLSIPQSIALRNHVKGRTNGLYQMKQAFEVFAPLFVG